MIFLLGYLIAFAFSQISYDQNTKALTITNPEPNEIGTGTLNDYSAATTCTITSNSNIQIGQQAFQLFKSLQTVSIRGQSVTLIQQAFQEVVITGKITIEATQGTIQLGQSSFISATLGSVELIATGDINIIQQSMQEVSKFNELYVKTNGNFQAGESSFISSAVKKFHIEAGGDVTFIQQAYQQTGKLDNFTVIAGGGITFGISSFISSNVHSIYLRSKGTISFGQQSFQECTNLEKLEIDTSADITFGLSCFIRSQIEKLDIDYEHNSAKKLAQSTISFEQQSFSECNELKDVDIDTPGDVTIKTGSFTDSKNLKTLDIDAGGKATVQAEAFKGCKSLDDPKIDAKDKDIADDAFDGKKKGGSSSSNKDDDSQDEQSAKTLGNFDINSVYLGTSPNIYVNLQIFVTLMRKARKTLGHVIPPPDFVHSAIWVGEKEPTDDSVGAIFVYGKYWNKYNMDTYLDKTGAKAYVMKFSEFKQRYPSIDPMKLNAHKKMKLFDFINEVKESGNWDAKNYNWPTNNCQHFTAKLIDILHATRNTPSGDDWIDLPKPVMRSLKSNEE